MDMNLNKFQEIVETEEPGLQQSLWSQRVGHHLVTEQQRVALSIFEISNLILKYNYLRKICQMLRV